MMIFLCVLCALAAAPLTCLSQPEEDPRPVIFVEDPSLLPLTRVLAGGWLVVVDASRAPNVHAQQLCVPSQNNSNLSIVWIFEARNQDSNPNLWRERLKIQGFQVLQIKTVRRLDGKIESQKILRDLCKQLSASFPHLSWYFQSRLALVEQRMDEISFPPWYQRIDRNDFTAN